MKYNGTYREYFLDFLQEWKSGKTGIQQALYTSYELEMATRRFGGKYVKKILITAKALGNVYIERAEEMEVIISVFSITKNSIWKC